MRRRLVLPATLLLAAVGVGGVLYAQLESTDRGILPLATSDTLEIDGIHVDVTAADAQTQPRTLKAALLETYRPQNYRGDVWLLTESDAGTHIDGSRNDLFVLRLEEHSGGGYLWDIDQLKASGFGIVRDELEAIDGEGVGGPVIRRVTAAPPDTHRGCMSVDERRPWDPESPLSNLTVEFDLTGPEEEGLSRAERRSLLEAA